MDIQSLKENPWKAFKNADFYQVWRYSRLPYPNEPMNSAMRETKGYFDSMEEALAEADRLNAQTEKGE